MNQLSDPSSWPYKYGDHLYSIAIFKVNNKETAEDIVQETFLSAIRAKDSFKGISNEKTWLLAILNNKIIDHYRKRNALKDTEQYILETEQSFNNTFFEVSNRSNGHWRTEAAPVNWHTDPADQALYTKEFFSILQYCVEKMPLRLASVFISKFFEEKEAELICKEQEISSSNYWVMIHRAKLLLRGCLEKKWFDKTDQAK